MKILVSIRTEDDLVYYKIEKNDHGGAITRVTYIYWNFNGRVEKFESYVGTMSEIRNLAELLKGLKL